MESSSNSTTQPAFTLPLIASMQSRQSANSSAAQHHSRHSYTPLHSPATNYDDLSTVPPRLVNVRLRLHLLQLSHHQRRQKSTASTISNSFQQGSSWQPSEPQSSPRNSEFSPAQSSCDGTSTSQPHERPRKEPFSAEQRKIRSERLRALWRDPQWREAMLAKQRSKETTSRKSESIKQLWRDESFRERMYKARVGREAPNKGISPSSVTRLRMSVARKGKQISEETRNKMSLAKRNRPKGDEWPKQISESRKGKTREYFAMRREFRALHKDLKLWSDSFKAKYGRLPDANTIDRFVAPMMILRIKRYLTLRDAIGQDEADIKSDIFSSG